MEKAVAFYVILVAFPALALKGPSKAFKGNYSKVPNDWKARDWAKLSRALHNQTKNKNNGYYNTRAGNSKSPEFFKILHLAGKMVKNFDFKGCKLLKNSQFFRFRMETLSMKSVFLI